MSEERCILLADDHPLVRDGLARVLAEALPGMPCVQVDSWTACLERLPDPALALAVVDLRMPGMDGLHGMRAVRERRPDVPLVAVSGEHDPRTVRQVLALGARGYIPKTDPAAVIRQAVALVWAGGTYIPPAGLQAGDTDPGEPATTGAAGAGLDALTPRQADVLRCLARGLPNKRIAHELGLSEGTVKIHLSAIMRVLRVRNRTEAVLRAQALGLGGG